MKYSSFGTHVVPLDPLMASAFCEGESMLSHLPTNAPFDIPYSSKRMHNGIFFLVAHYFEYALRKQPFTFARMPS